MKKESFLPFNFRDSYIRSFLRYICMIFGVLLIGVWVFSNTQYLSGKWPKTLWILDNSLSMVVQDMGGSGDIVLSRFDRAKDMILSLSPHIWWYQALMIFWKSASLVLPFSTDQKVFSATVNWLAPVLYSSSTDIETALWSVDLIYWDDDIHVIVLTDGERTIEENTESLSNSPKKITFIGIWTQAWGMMLQWYDSVWRPRYKQYEWKPAISRLDKSYLEVLKEKLRANLFVVSDNDTYEKTLESLIKKTKDDNLLNDQRIILIWIVLLLSWLMLSPYSYKTR